MCGIAGMLLAPGRTADPALLRAMGGVLDHRGPDNFGAETDGNYGVAQTRLSILDLTEAGNQPFADDRHSLVYNGEIYNFPALREKLVQRGRVLTGGSDTEVLFHHLVEFGVPATLAALRGMFAFSFFDRSERTLHLCRDRLGIKPLSYVVHDGDIFWASEVKALARVRPIEIDPLRLVLSTNIQFDGRNDHTLFRGVENVPRGTYLVVRPGQAPTSVRYHDWVDEISEARYRELDAMSMEEAGHHLDDLFERSMTGMLLSDAPMGVFASGGIDSSLIAAVAFQQKPELSLFSSNVVGRHSEIEDARLVSRSLGTPLHESDYGKDDLLTSWARATWFYEAPIIAHVNALPLGHVAALAREHGVKAVLTGEGSDELFLGYAVHVARRYDRLRAPVDLLQRMYGIVPMVRRHLFPKDTSSVLSFLPGVASNFEEDLARRTYTEAYTFVPEDEREDAIATAHLLQFHLASLLHRNDRMGMMASIESRFPFLDDDIVRFALNLPRKFKVQRVARVHNRRHPFLLDKAIVRHLCRGRVPESILQKEKVGFPTFGLQSIVLRPGFFDDGYLADVLELDQRGRRQLQEPEYRYLAARLASAEVFGRQFGLGQDHEQVEEHLQRFVSVDTTINTKVDAT